MLNNDTLIQSTDSAETYYAHGTRKVLVCKKEEMKYNYVIKQCQKWLI